MKRMTMECCVGSMLMALAVGACGDDSSSDFRSSSAAPSGPGASASTDPSAPPSTDAAVPSGSANGGALQRGQLTAGVWDDNLNFGFFQKYVEITGNLDGMPAFSALEREAAKQRWSQRTGSTELDVAFVIDTTGSMGDELSYVQREIGGIADALKGKFPSMTPRFGLVVYKDQGDDYVTRSFPFRDLSGFRTALEQQRAGGGGDYPEASAEALDETLKLDWRTGAVARIAFWVADAPHHADRGSSFKSTIDGAVQKDVHLYPIAASGADPLTELTMRSAAQLTGGRYLFLTDDSGIGNAHAEPNIPCYHVTKWNSAVVRMVESELKGTHVPPDASEIVRTVGSPVDGTCTTKSQGTVAIY